MNPRADDTPERMRALLSGLEELVHGLPMDVLPEFSGRLEALRLTALLRALRAPQEAPSSNDRLLSPQEAASVLGQRLSWVYDHANELGPVRLPGRSLRFSQARLARLGRR